MVRRVADQGGVEAPHLVQRALTALALGPQARESGFRGRCDVELRLSPRVSGSTREVPKMEGLSPASHGARRSLVGSCRRRRCL